ncbi:MAG: DUF4140 domain-containing protein [Bacteroidales bacterium]|nr:DUF4140 domain-containing protein [Bacteroidales bacterium]
MKKFVFIFILLPFTLFAQNITKVNSNINEIKIFLNGAQITRISDINLQKGDNKILISNLPDDLDPKTVNVKGQGDFIIQTVNASINYLSDYAKDPTYKILKDSLELLQQKLDKNNTILQVYIEEEAMIKANKTIGGTQNGTNVNELIKASEFFRSRLLDIKTRSLAIQRDNKELLEAINKLQNQIASYEK